MILTALRRLATLVVCFSILALAAPVGAQEESEQMQIVVAAERLVQQQKPDAALAELRKVFETNDRFGPAYFVAGLAYGAKSQPQEAFDSFVKAAELRPGWGDAHRQASFWAANMGDLETSWDHAIKAHQAGTDMADAFEGLQTMGPAPDDLEALLSAYRVFVAPMNLEQFLAHEENPFGRVVNSGGSSFDTDNVSNTKATGVGARTISESSADRATVMQRTRQRIADSRQFGLVGSQAAAQYILVIEVDEIGESMANRPMKGYLNLLDAQSGEEAYRRRFEMRNIVSQADVNRDLNRIIGLLEEWAEERVR